MLAQPESSLPPFTVEITPTAWKQIAHFSQDLYRVLRERLRALAELASVGWQPGPVPLPEAQAQAPLSFRVGEFAACYVADPRSRSIRLLEVTRRPASGAFKVLGREAAGHA